MNLHALKTECERAVSVLVEKYGYKPDAFNPADGDETVAAPKDMEPRFVRHGFLEPGPLPGTPVCWLVDYYGEGDCYLPLQRLRDRELEDSLPDDYWAAEREGDNG